MLDLQTQRKTKIILSDYDYRRDIENRLLMSRFTNKDFLVLQEVLFSTVRFSLRKMARTLELTEEVLTAILKKLGQTGLLTIDKDTVDVDKEMRKYLETQVLKFEEDFKPGVEFLLGLLRKVPIHVLPTWYAIPRTSNNIFESIIERYLATPQTYYRYLQDFYLHHPHLAQLVKDLFSSPTLKFSGQEVIDKYRMDREQFEETMLLLEFSLIACLRYEQVGDEWKEIVTPFDEWREHLTFLRTTQAWPILEEEEVTLFRPQDFSFVRDLSEILKFIQTKAIALKATGKHCSPTAKSTSTALGRRLLLDFEEEEGRAYFSRLVVKLRLLKLAEFADGELSLTSNGEEWLGMDDEEKALFLYRHPHNRLISEELPEPMVIDKSVREAEKSIQRVLSAGWVKLEDVLKGALVSFTDEPAVALKKLGRHWKYARPDYTEDQLKLIRATLGDWLFETGVIALGKWNNELCLKVTDFGHTLFGH